MPLYLKSHSRGEYVFDYAWAQAFARHGLDYYPKLLGAVPFTPVPGPRILARSHADRVLLAQRAAALARDNALSSLHVLLPSAEDSRALREAGDRKSTRLNSSPQIASRITTSAWTK